MKLEGEWVKELKDRLGNTKKKKKKLENKNRTSETYEEILQAMSNIQKSRISEGEKRGGDKYKNRMSEITSN